jgi:tetratricopeptide (TPR) repeat protein
MSLRNATTPASPYRPPKHPPGRGSGFSISIILGVLGLPLAAVLPLPLHAQADSGWIGKRVVQKHRGFQLRIENQVIEPKGLATYRVEQVNGPWLWLRAKELSGWAPADQVVPIEQAIEFFTDYIRANPGDPHGYTLRATIWWREKKELDIALADCNEAIRLDPAKGYVYGNRGIVWAAKKEYDKAIADYNEAIRLDPMDAITYNNRGNTWRNKKECARAVADYNEAIRFDPKYADAYNGRACLWATCPDGKFRDGKKATESATRACELSAWSDPIILSTLAEAHAEAGHFKEAVEWQEKAIRLLTGEAAKRIAEAELRLFKDNRPYHGDYSDLP